MKIYSFVCLKYKKIFTICKLQTLSWDKSSVKHRALGFDFGVGPKLIGFLVITGNGDLLALLLFCCSAIFST